MKFNEIKALENKLNDTLSNAEKFDICIKLAKEYSFSYSTKLKNIIKIGLSISNLKALDKCELLFFKLNTTFNSPEINAEVYKELLELINEHDLGQDRLDRLALNDNILLFKKRNYIESLNAFKKLLLECFTDKVLSNYAKFTKIRVYQYLAWCEMLMGNAEQSLQYFEYQKKIALEVKDHKKVASIIDNIANLYANDKNYEKAHAFMEESLDYYKKYDNLEYAGKTYLHIAGNYMNTGNLEKAIEFYTLTITLAEQNEDIINQILSWNNLSRIAIMKNDFDTFFEIRNKLLEHIDFILKDRILAVSFCRQSIEGFMKHGDFDEALIWADKFESYQTNSENVVDLDRIYKLKIELYKALKNKNKEIDYLNKYLDLKDKILERAKRKALEEFEAKFQNEKKEREIQNLKLESVSLQLQSLRSQMNPHFVFNTIASITSIINPDNVEQTKKLLHHFARLMRANLDFSELETISLEEEIMFLSDYMALEKNRLGNQLKYKIIYPETLDLDFVSIPSMIIQPYIENAIKHGIMSLLSKMGEISISFTLLKEDLLLCSIKDNGIGREAAEKIKQKSSIYGSKSTKITANRLSLLNQSNDYNLVSVEYIDLKNEKNQSLGTEVLVKIEI